MALRAVQRQLLQVERTVLVAGRRGEGGERDQWFCWLSRNGWITLLFVLRHAVHTGHERVVAAHHVLAEDVEVGAVRKREQRNRRNASDDDDRACTQVERVVARRAEALPDLVEMGHSQLLVPLIITSHLRCHPDVIPVPHQMDHVNALVHRLQNGHSERADEEGDQKKSQIRELK